MYMEYKFRAKNKDSGKWEYGYYVKYIKRQVSPIGDFLDESDIVHLIFQSGFADWNMERPLNAVEIIPETIGMFTGLTDKNSVEIYEGDLLKTEENDIYRVAFVESSCAFIACFYPDDYDTVYLTDTCPNIYDEVIGNIYEVEL